MILSEFDHYFLYEDLFIVSVEQADPRGEDWPPVRAGTGLDATVYLVSFTPLFYSVFFFTVIIC